MAESFEMFSLEGNREVRELVAVVLNMAPDLSDAAIYARLKEGMNEIEKRHPEVWDTAVREAIIGRIEIDTKRSLTIYF